MAASTSRVPLWCFEGPTAETGGHSGGRSKCLDCSIRHLAFCAALDEDQIVEIERIAGHKSVQPGQCFAMEGDRGDIAYNVISGMVKLYKSLPDGRTQITGFLLPGDFLGLPSREEYTYSAEAVVPTSLCRFPRAPLVALFAKIPDLEKRFLDIVKDELTAAQDHMLLLGRKSASERIACFLLGFSKRAHRLGWPVDPLLLPMHRIDIADYLGLTVETVSRTLSTLKKQGVVDIPRSEQIILANRDRLEELCLGA
jgi:CRP/FNR family transcriptional regulator